jgi:type II secretory pathway component PulF
VVTSDFAYTAQAEDGQRFSGEVEATDADAALRRLYHGGPEMRQIATGDVGRRR